MDAGIDSTNPKEKRQYAREEHTGHADPPDDWDGPSSAKAASCVGAYSFEHECEKILDFDVGEGPERDVWVGEITAIDGELPDEDWCLHIQTPEKPEIVFGLVHADLVCLTGIIRAILGHVPDNPVAERIAERARKA